MWRDQLAQWKPGDFFAIKPTRSYRFYRNIPYAGDQEGSITMPNVNINLIYTVSAVYEESTWTAIRFQNQHAIANLRNPVLQGPGPVESLWTIARHIDRTLCHHVSIRTGLLRPNYYEHLIHHPYVPNGTRLRSRSRSR